MAYFSSGTEGEKYNEKYCERCINWRDLQDGRGSGCPIWDIHFLFAYDECNKKTAGKKILDTLIPSNSKTGFAEECSMFLKA
jgi:hypothetical protein